MSKKTKKLSVDEIEQLAKPLIRQELDRLELPSDVRKQMTISIFFRNDERIVCVKIPGETPREGKILACVCVNSISGEAQIDNDFLKEQRWMPPGHIE